MQVALSVRVGHHLSKSVSLGHRNRFNLVDKLRELALAFMREGKVALAEFPS